MHLLKFHITRALLKAVTIDVRGSGSGAALGVSWHLMPAGRNIAVGDRCPIALTDQSYRLHHLVSCQRRRHRAPSLRSVIRSAQWPGQFSSAVDLLVLYWREVMTGWLQYIDPQDTELRIFCLNTCYHAISSVMITSSQQLSHFTPFVPRDTRYQTT